MLNAQLNKLHGDLLKPAVHDGLMRRPPKVSAALGVVAVGVGADLERVADVDAGSERANWPARPLSPTILDIKV